MSTESITSLVEIGLFYVLVLGFAVWQVVKMRRVLARDRAAKAARGDAPKTDDQAVNKN